MVLSEVRRTEEEKEIEQTARCGPETAIGAVKSA